MGTFCITLLIVVLPLISFAYGLYRGGWQYFKESTLALLVAGLLFWGYVISSPRVYSGPPGGEGPQLLDYFVVSLISLLASVFLLYRAGQFVFVRPPGVCRCGYDLTGNVSGACPECGAKT